jgi:hypothetical protein
MTQRKAGLPVGCLSWSNTVPPFRLKKKILALEALLL